MSYPWITRVVLKILMDLLDFQINLIHENSIRKI